MTAKLNLIIPTNADLRMVVDVVGGPESLAGYTGHMQIRSTTASAAALADYDTEITIDPGNRLVSLVVPASETSTYTWDRGVYDLVITGLDGTYRLVQGAVSVSPAVTR